jgi:hypothetical protein
LNLAVKARLVSIEKAREWHDLKRLKDAGKRRDLFLDRNQRRHLRDACQGAVRDLVEAAMLTGCRAGELAKALCRYSSNRKNGQAVNSLIAEGTCLIAAAVKRQVA